ncbi:hypothetical protein [Variovorax sp. EL159]|uniref:hypothetical protein n=1 Tax=Variovorax sp. EL159 TaxID=1566270 RepID=UPI00089086CF|nr:hypothetical protein [Variovorax sp. EL159]SCX74660.1 hypothetical protein SAMN03159363_6407 [Variovorax sp. EL159]
MKRTIIARRLKTAVALGVGALVLASCGGGGGNGNDAAALAAIAAANAAAAAAAGGATPPPPPAPPPVVNPPAPPAIQAKCAMDTTVAPSYEEQRLPNKLSRSDALSFSQQLLQASGFDKFGPDFANKLCSNGLAGASTYDDAVTLLHAEGLKLWQAALDRVQGRAVQGTLPKSDDRMLYWARLTMTLALRQWKPDFPLTDDQRAALQVEFEKASRGQYAIDFPEGPKYKRVLVSGFDPFTLGDAGTDGDLSIRIGNPSGATILSLDGNTVALPDGTTAVIRTFILPVNYGPFIAGMQEDALGPWFKPGAKRVDASVSMSQGGGEFDLEHYNGRYHYAAFPGNDNLNPPCADGGGFPSALECDIFPPERWLGYASKPWQRDASPQFTVATLPFQKLIDAKTGAGIINRDTNQTGGWAVVRHDPYTVGPCTKAAGDAATAYDAAQAAVKAALAAFSAPGVDWTVAYKNYTDAVAAAALVTPPNPLETNCALTGGGGNYLSNASAYRNTLMRDTFKLNIPAGHIHTPVMTAFGSGSDGKITDATFEGRRDSIVAQARNLVMALASSLATPPTP